MKRVVPPLVVAVFGLVSLASLVAQEGRDAPARPRDKIAVEVKRDIVYAKPGDDIELKLDAYLPRGDGPNPAVLVIHGGAWASGNKAQLALHARRFAELGMAAFAINYRLAPKYTFPAQIDDCKSAVRWLRKNAADYRVDSERIGAYGYSAGGHLAALLGVTGASAESDGDGAKADTRLQCICAGGAPCDFQQIPENLPLLAFWLGGTRAELPEVYRKASPLAFVGAKCPPMFFYHGSKDELVNIKDVERMVEALKDAGVTTDLFVIEGAGHMPAVLNPQVAERSAEFLAKHLKLGSKEK